MGDLDIGDEAPDFTLEGTEGTFTLSEHRGERVVLLFYPADDSTVCTQQFCSYRDDSEKMDALDATVVGISNQDMDSKREFESNHGLTTTLLVDPDAEVANAYDVYSERFGATKRAVFIVDEQGRIAHENRNFLSLTFDDADDLEKALAELDA